MHDCGTLFILESDNIFCPGQPRARHGFCWSISRLFLICMTTPLGFAIVRVTFFKLSIKSNKMSQNLSDSAN